MDHLREVPPPTAQAIRRCTSRFDRWSEPRMTWVIQARGRRRPRRAGTSRPRRARASSSPVARHRPRHAPRHPKRARAPRPRRTAWPARSAARALRRRTRRATRGRRGSPAHRPRRSSTGRCRRCGGRGNRRARRRSGGSRPPSRRSRRAATPSGSGRSGRERSLRHSTGAQASIVTWPGCDSTRPSRAKSWSMAPGRSPPRARHGCRHRARRPRSSSGRRRGTPARPGGAPARRARRSRRPGALALPLEPLRRPRVHEPEARDRDVRLVAVLLEEHPLQHLRALVGVGACTEFRPRSTRGSRSTPRAGDQIVEDKRQDAQPRVEVAEQLGAVRAVDHAHVHRLVREPELRQQGRTL